MRLRRRTPLTLLLVLPLLLAAAPAAAGTGTSADTGTSTGTSTGTAAGAGAVEPVLLGYARDTWRSMVALTDPGTGLPADNMTGPVTAPVRSGYTSPTNIGGYLWSTVVARDLGIISAAEATARLTRTLTTLAGMEHHELSGLYYNWYDEETGD